MAIASVINTSHTYVTVHVEGLENNASAYDYFQFTFTQNGTQILKYSSALSLSIKYFDFAFYNDSYLGNNWFAPATTYSVTVTCYFAGTGYPLNTVQFTTDSIVPPTLTITPTVYPTVKNQGSYGSCVAMSLSTAMEIFKSKAMGSSSSYENFSVSYIYGSDGRTVEDMFFNGGVNLCKQYGSPRWELVTNSFPDSMSKTNSLTVYNNASTLARSNAMKQAFTGSANIDFYDCASVQNAISTYGYFMLNFRIPNNFYYIGSDGIVPQPSGGYSGANHSIALIGVTTINSKKYWIAHNSWGTSWGLGGRCYIPYDWGCGVQSPMGSSNTSNTCGWTSECYSVWNGNVPTANPSPQTNVTATQVDKTTSINVSWGSSATVLVYAKVYGTTNWYPKPSFGSTFTGTTGQITADNNNTKYEIMTIVVSNNLLSAQSTPIVIEITSHVWAWNSAELTAFNNQGLLTAVTYTRWNEFVQTVSDVRVSKNLSAVSSAALMTSSDKAMTATRFNLVLNALKAMTTVQINTVSTGNIIYGNYFTHLSERLNAIA